MIGEIGGPDENDLAWQMCVTFFWSVVTDYCRLLFGSVSPPSRLRSMLKVHVYHCRDGLINVMWVDDRRELIPRHGEWCDDDPRLFLVWTWRCQIVCTHQSCSLWFSSVSNLNTPILYWHMQCRCIYMVMECGGWLWWIEREQWGKLFQECELRVCALVSPQQYFSLFPVDISRPHSPTPPTSSTHVSACVPGRWEGVVG